MTGNVVLTETDHVRASPDIAFSANYKMSKAQVERKQLNQPCCRRVIQFLLLTIITISTKSDNLPFEEIYLVEMSADFASDGFGIESWAV